MDTRENANLLKGRRCVSKLFLPTLKKIASNFLTDLHKKNLRSQRMTFIILKLKKLISVEILGLISKPTVSEKCKEVYNTYKASKCTNFHG